MKLELKSSKDQGYSQQTVCVIGASAGGVTEIQLFFKELEQARQGIDHRFLPIFVVIQHLPSNVPSYMDDLISRCCSLPTISIEDDIVPLPGRIYLMPPASFLQISTSDDQIFWKPMAVTKDIRNFRLISKSMEVLAEQYRRHCIGVILSGSGNDGAEGMRAIMASGGKTYVQNPTQASYPSMPLATLATGVVFEQIGVPDLAWKLFNRVRPTDNSADVDRLKMRNYSSKAYQSVEQSASSFRSTDMIEREDQDVWPDVLHLLSEASGTDFSNYKTATIYRRVLLSCQKTVTSI